MVSLCVCARFAVCACVDIPAQVCLCACLCTYCVCSHVFIFRTVHLDTHVNVRDLRLGAKGAGRGGELDY